MARNSRPASSLHAPERTADDRLPFASPDASQTPASANGDHRACRVADHAGSRWPHRQSARNGRWRAGHAEKSVRRRHERRWWRNGSSVKRDSFRSKRVFKGDDRRDQPIVDRSGGDLDAACAQFRLWRVSRGGSGTWQGGDRRLWYGARSGCHARRADGACRGIAAGYRCDCIGWRAVHFAECDGGAHGRGRHPHRGVVICSHWRGRSCAALAEIGQSRGTRLCLWSPPRARPPPRA